MSSNQITKKFKGRYRGIYPNWKDKLINKDGILLISIESGKLSIFEYNSIKKILSKKLKKVGKIKIYVKPNKPLTKKHSLRMGKGKGNIDYLIVNIPAGKTLIQLTNISKLKAYFILKSIKTKLSIKTKIIINN